MRMWWRCMQTSNFGAVARIRTWLPLGNGAAGAQYLSACGLELQHPRLSPPCTKPSFPSAPEKRVRGTLSSKGLAKWFNTFDSFHVSKVGRGATSIAGMDVASPHEPPNPARDDKMMMPKFGRPILANLHHF